MNHTDLFIAFVAVHGILIISCLLWLYRTNKRIDRNVENTNICNTVMCSAIAKNKDLLEKLIN